MTKVPPVREKSDGLISKGEISFSVESRILRELGERLVKQPEVALLELIKNAFDADATKCTIQSSGNDGISVADDGCGMTLEQFEKKWMRVGTSDKAVLSESNIYGRQITGEKGIGRFAVRFLGSALKLTSVADDQTSGKRTKLTVTFDWPTVDQNTDLNRATVPYTFESVDRRTPLGTQLDITDLRIGFSNIDWHQVGTGVVSPLQVLFKNVARAPISRKAKKTRKQDPGFDLRIEVAGVDSTGNLAEAMLRCYVLRAEVSVTNNKVSVQVFERDKSEPILNVTDTYKNDIAPVAAQLRFFPRRTGTFWDAPMDGRKAYTWVAENSGVAVFDRNFRVLPYGTEGDDWLQLSRDVGRRERDPISKLAKKHFEMPKAVYSDPAQNWMLRLPSDLQVIGLVQVAGRRNADATAKGLIASADREGFVENEAYYQLFDVIRGAAEMIAVADRMIQKRDDKRQLEIEREEILERTREAIEDIEQSPYIPAAQKKRVIAMLVQSQEQLEHQAATSKARESQFEVMSLLGVVAGYMTHEFGIAMQDLREAQEEIRLLANSQPSLKKIADDLTDRIERLAEFSKYTRAYVQGTRSKPSKTYPVLPRIRQIVRLMGTYASDRGIDMETEIDKDLEAPLVPAPFYNGIIQNLYTNALKAITTKSRTKDRTIAFRAWNDEKWHYLQVSDTGVGIPASLKERVFDPLFSTTEMNTDPLGSGMGLGLSLV